VNRKNLIFGVLIGAFCLVFAFTFILFGLDVFGPAEYNVSFNNSTAEATGAYAAIINFKTFIMGITPLAAYNYVLYKTNWHLFKKDNSYQKGTYSPSNEYIKEWANDIKKGYPLNNNQEKGEAVFNYTYEKIVTKWHVHDNTACPIQDVAKYHEANCAETARIVYNLALAVGIPKEDVQYVHSALQHHYWVQIRCNGNWTNVDPSHAADDTYHVTAFGLSEPAGDTQVVPSDEIA